MLVAGVRAAFIASSLAAKIMIPQRRGLIVNIRSWAGRKYIGNVIYGVSKAATDKMTSDMAQELRPHGIAAVSLYPGPVRTEAILSSGWSICRTAKAPYCGPMGRSVAARAVRRCKALVQFL
jgi:dehydrogenase/reductase SDR family protein 1